MYHLTCPRLWHKLKHLLWALCSYTTTTLLIFLGQHTFHWGSVIHHLHTTIFLCLGYLLIKAKQHRSTLKAQLLLHHDPFPTPFQFKSRNLKLKETERLLRVPQPKAWHCFSTSATPPAQSSQRTPPYLSFLQFSLFSWNCSKAGFALGGRDGTAWSGTVLTSILCNLLFRQGVLQW